MNIKRVYFCLFYKLEDNNMIRSLILFVLEDSKKTMNIHIERVCYLFIP